MKISKKLVSQVVLLLLYIVSLAVYIPSYEASSWLFSWSGIPSSVTISMVMLLMFFVVLLGIGFGLKLMFRKSWKIGVMSFWSLLGGIYLLNLGVASLPFVIGWDAVTLYFLTVEQIAVNGHFPTGIYPYLVELILGIVGRVIGFQFMPMLTVAIGSLLLLWGLWRWTNVLKLSPILQRWTVFLLFLIPTLQFQMTKDIKIDVILTGVILLALSFWYEKKLIKTALLLGIAPLIKLTAFWFWPGFILYCGYTAFQLRNKKKKFFTHMKKIGLSFLLIILPMSLWCSWNVYRSEVQVTTKNFTKILLQSSKQNIKIKPLKKGTETLFPRLEIKSVPVLSLQRSLEITQQVFAETTEQEVTKSVTPPRNQKRPKATARKEELERYGGWNNNFFARIHTVFTSANITLGKKHHTDLGFVWIWMVVGSLCALWLKREKKTTLEAYWIYGTLLVTFMLWIYQGQGVAWYGVPMLLGLMPIGILWMGKTIFSQKIMSILLVPPVVLSLLTWMFHYQADYLLVAKNYWSDPNPQALIEVKKQFYREEMIVGDILNESENRNHKIWKVGSLTNVFIDRFNERVIEDGLIDRWSQFSFNKSDEKILKQLQQNDINWFILDRGTAGIEKDPFGTLHQKYNNLSQFLDTYGELRHDVRRLGLYQINFDRIDEKGD